MMHYIESEDVARELAIWRDPRFWALLGYACLAFTRGIGYTPLWPVYSNDPPAGIASLTPLWIDVYAGLWLVSGACAIAAGCVRKKSWYLSVIIGAPALLWASAYYITAMTHGIAVIAFGGLLFQFVSVMAFWTSLIEPRVVRVKEADGFTYVFGGWRV